jgi:glycosyltransferase involved in cell wall biosynthesis
VPTARLVFYSHTASVSGAEVVLLSVLKGLDRSRFTPVVLCPAGTLGAACEALQVEHSPVPELQARFTRNPLRLVGYLASILRAIFGIRRALRSQRPSLIHANTVRAGLVASLATLGLPIPILWHIHDILPQHPFTSLIRKLVRVLPRLSLLAVSHATAESFRGAGKDALRMPIEVVYNSVDIERYCPDEAARVRMRRALGLASDQVAVGVVGQLTPRKGLLELVEAFASARQRMPSAVLVLVGEALFNEANRAYGRALERRVEELGVKDRVWLVGGKRDIPAVMNAVDLLAQNSLVEPLGLALMEGFACGRTAAATGVDGVLEIVDHGRTGLLSPQGDAEALVRNIETLVADPELRRRMGRAARQKTIDEFTPDLQMRRMHRFYERLLQPSSAPSAQAAEKFPA